MCLRTDKIGGDIVNQTGIIIEKILQQEKIKYDPNMVEKVTDFAEDMYQGQVRHGQTMLAHGIGVASEVAKLRLDDTSVYAGLLHGTIRCEGYQAKKMKELFGSELVEIITTVEKVSCLNFRTKEKVDNENLRKMFMAIAKDIRTVIIKLVDRLYNMRNIEAIEEAVKLNMAKECLQIYAPIAHRLGMSQIKSELEDISFRVLMPEEYHEIKRQIDEKKSQREAYIEDRIAEITSTLKKEGIIATVYGRPKHFYSIYKKMKSKNCKADDLFDLLAIRIIVDSIKDCYTALGLMHDMYKPMPGRFKDYIAVPKTNMYQSLHTTVFGEEAKPFEIQIRTWDMHRVADYGVAAHFSYKEKTGKVSEADKKIVWLRQTLEIQKELADNTENLAKMKVELFGEEVFVFTPKGDIKSLPKGSTPVDFAYAIHQKIAEKMVGAKINSKMVSLNTKLENTDIVEIITSPKSNGPSTDWLKYVKTTSAKNKITSFLKKQGREVNIAKGKEYFDKIVKKQKEAKDILMKEEYVKIMLQKMHFKTLEDCYENIGFGSISPVKVVNRLVEAYEESVHPADPVKLKKKENSRHKRDHNDLVVVDGIEGCLVKFAKCCSPIPGDKIVGYITHSNGVSIHRADCHSLQHLDIHARTIPVSWRPKVTVSFVSRIRIRANNRENVLTDVLKVMKELKISICEMNTKVTEDRENVIELAIEITDIQELLKVIKYLKKIDSVFEVKRVR